MNKINTHNSLANGEFWVNKTACGKFGYDNDPHKEKHQTERLFVKQRGIAVGFVNAGVHQSQVCRRIHYFY